MAALILLSLCWIWLSVSVLRSAASHELDQKIITAEFGQGITLTCRAPNNNNIIVVEWSRADLGTEYVSLYRGKTFVPDNQHPSFKDRVDLQDRQMKDGDVSLILKNVTTADSGTYECRVFSKGANRRKRANLNTEPINSIRLNVDPPAQTGGHTEDGISRGHFGLVACGLLLLLVLIVALMITHKLPKKNLSNHPSSDDPAHICSETRVSLR